MYKIIKQDNEYVVSNKHGVIIAYFDTKAEAQDYRQAQMRDDERSAVMFAYNRNQTKKELYAEFINEFC